MQICGGICEVWHVVSPVKVIMDGPEVAPPLHPYKVTFLHEGNPITIHIDPARIPYGSTGLPGSFLDIALEADVELEHACGGVSACSTCHVKIKEGLETCNEPSDDELDQLDEAPDLSLNSRLGCQAVPNGTKDLIVEIPSWNKNLVREKQG